MASAAQTYGVKQGPAAAPASAAMAARPFAQAAKHGREYGPNYSFQPAAATKAFGPSPLPATGYLRRVHIETVCAGGAGAATGAGDFPFNFWNLVRLTEPNGAPVCELTGYNLLLANIYGGYAGVNDPRNDPDYTAAAANPNIQPFIPIELDATGVGSLSNLSASSAFRLTLIGEASSNIWSSAPATTIPTATVNILDDYWTLPNPMDQDGHPQATAPPFPGTIQLWSQQQNIGLQSGTQRTQLSRMGNQLRTVIIVTRSAGARNDTVFPNPYTLRWDDINLHNGDPQTIRKTMREYVNGLTARDTGVYVFPFNFGFGRFAGGNGVSSYLPTVTATRFELSGPSSAGTLDWIVNDVSAAPIAGIARSTVGGGLGYTPPAPPPAAGAM